MLEVFLFEMFLDFTCLKLFSIITRGSDRPPQVEGLFKFAICSSQMQIGSEILRATSCQTVGFLTNRPKRRRAICECECDMEQDGVGNS